MSSIEKTSLAMLAVVGGVIFLAYSIFKTQADDRQCAADAKGASFADCATFSLAKAAGISEPAKWEEKLQRDRAAAEERAKQQEKIAAARREVAENAAAIRAELSRNPASKMAVSSFQWKLGGFGSVGVISPTIENKNTFDVKDIEIECTFSGKSGTRLSAAKHVIYDIIKASSKKTFQDVNIGLINSQSAKAFCQINSARIALLDR